MQQSKMILPPANSLKLFGEEKAALEAVEIDLSSVVEAGIYFHKAKQADPEFNAPFYQAKIPAAGGRSFDIITGDESLDVSVQSFKGVIFSFHSCNALFETSEDDQISNNIPLCQAMLATEGITRDGEKRLCAQCEQNAWGSGKNGGKACKNMRRLYILAEGCSIPLFISVPPTSIKTWEAYKSAALGVRRYSPQEVVTEFSLSAATSKTGKRYSILKFKAVGYVTPETSNIVYAFINAGHTGPEININDYNAPLIGGQSEQAQ